jgi:predicted TIM-barrel enzyme
VGSGTTPDNIAAVRAVAQGAIVGTYLHERGQIGAPLDPERVRRMVGG